jgi:hypothetical protein
LRKCASHDHLQVEAEACHDPAYVQATCRSGIGARGMAELDVFYIDELIAVLRAQHGGGQGAPEVVDGHRVGASINRSGVVLLSAQLQTFVEDVFFDCAAALRPHLGGADEATGFRRSYSRWGNPSADNIGGLFHRLGVKDVLGGFVVRKCPNARIHGRLDQLNQVRNGIAHGALDLRAGNTNGNPSLVRVEMYRNFAVNFAARFPAHALAAVS